MTVPARRSIAPAVNMAALAALVLGGALAACGDDDQPDPESPSGDAAAAAFVACPDSIPELGAGLTATGKDDRIQAVLLDASLVPARKFGNEWTLELRGADDEPLADAEITSGTTFMPVHQHYGRPPVIEALPDPGQVRAAIRFTMRGPWQVNLQASSASAGDDKIMFDVCVEE